jgi:tight adherence protein B
MILVAVFLAGLSAWVLIPSPVSRRLAGVSPTASPATTSQAWKFEDLLRRRMRKADRLKANDAIVIAISSLAAELRAGQSPNSALVNAGEGHCPWPVARAVALTRGDTMSALVEDSQKHPELKSLVACWRVGLDSGSGLAASITKLAASLRTSQDIRLQLEAELAGPKATARMLALLPVVGIALGYLMGAEPITWLVLNPMGWIALVFGGGLTCLGIWWTNSIALRVEKLL